jgi:type I restriction enzyme S subunit
MKQGWEIKKLGEVCELSAGGDVPKDNFSETQTEKHQIPIYANGEKNEGFYGYTSIAKVTKPSITVSARGTIGFSVKRLEAFFPVVRLIVVTPRNLKDLDLDYLDYALKTIDFKHSGSSIPQLTVPMIRDYEIPLPPLPEQQSIVSILEEAFAAIARAKANAEQNLKNAAALFESYLQGVFENGNWEEKRLEEVCLLISKGSSPKWQGIKYVDVPGVLFVTSENVGENTLMLEQRKYVEEKFNISDKKSILRKGDVLTNIVGASIGRTAIFDLDDNANINQAVCLIRCNQESLFNQYLMYLLNSPFTKQHLHDNEVNNARANLSLGFFRSLLIPLPPLTEQQTIVRQLDALRAETQKLEAIYQQKLLNLEELKKSVLQKAFAGELTTGKKRIEKEK